MPEVPRTQTNYSFVVVEHHISLVRINIKDLIKKMTKRKRVLSGNAITAYEACAPLVSSIINKF